MHEIKYNITIKNTIFKKKVIFNGLKLYSKFQ